MEVQRYQGINAATSMKEGASTPNISLIGINAILYTFTSFNSAGRSIAYGIGLGNLSTKKLGSSSIQNKVQNTEAFHFVDIYNYLALFP